MQNQYRIDNKQNVYSDGKKTAFNGYKYDKDAGGYVFCGQYFMNGWDASDDACLRFVKKCEDEFD